MELSILSQKNPWWKGKEHFEEDEDYRKWKEKQIKWVPNILEDIELRPFSLNFIFGPRQAGKTTLIKLLIKKLLDEGNKPESIFFFRCDEIKDYKELRELLETYLDFRKNLGIKCSYIFLDEITFPHEWFRTIKSFIDDGIFREDVLFLSGSTTLEIRKEAEYFPGRRGFGKDYLLLPLSFREFVEVVNPKIREKLPDKLKSIEKREIEEKILKLIPFSEELNSILETYFITGGFPEAINDYFKYKKVREETIRTIISWIITDLTKIGKSWENAREVLKSILTKIPSAISWENIAKETTFKSPKTVSSYLRVLNSMFILKITYHINPNNVIVEFAKNKKINFLDPLFFKVFEEWCLIEVERKTEKMIEAIVASHLFRRFKDVFFWKDGSEVDCIINLKNKLVGFEVKWSERPEAKKVFLGKLKEIYTLSKNKLDLENNIIPTALMLSLL
jgi:uncharacterized protein